MVVKEIDKYECFLGKSIIYSINEYKEQLETMSKFSTENK